LTLNGSCPWNRRPKWGKLAVASNGSKQIKYCRVSISPSHKDECKLAHATTRSLFLPAAPRQILDKQSSEAQRYWGITLLDKRFLVKLKIALEQRSYAVAGLGSGEKSKPF